jgi:alcohol dehydrogenase class IV
VNYDLLIPRKVVFGWGRRSELGALATTLGKRAFLVIGSRTLIANGTIAELKSALQSAGISTVEIATISREPLVEDVDAAARRVAEIGIQPGDFVIATGGGSGIDLGKAVAALATNRQSDTVKDYLEGVGRGLKIEARPLPLLAMPTTSGTGSEATKNAVISNLDPPFKKSLRSDQMIPEIVLIDPELTVSAPRDTTVWSGLDAITQLIESYVTKNARPVPQALCLEGLGKAIPALSQLVANPHDRPAREAMAHAAFLSGVALANSGLGMAHGVAAALGVTCNVPHGLACAVMLPTVMSANRRIRQPEMATLGRLLTALQEDSRTLDDETLAADYAVQFITDYCRRLGIPQRLRDLGVTKDQIEPLVLGSQGNSMNANPRQITDCELHDTLEALW